MLALKLLRKNTLRVFILLVFSSPLYSFQSLPTKKLSDVYRELINAKTTHYDLESVHIVDDLSARNYDGDTEQFIQDLSKVLKMEIPTDSSGIISTVKTMNIDNVTGVNINLFILNLELLEMRKGNFENLNFYSLAIDTVDIDSSQVRNTFIIQDSKFTEFFDAYSKYTAHQIYNTEYRGYYNMYYVSINREFLVYDSKFKEGAHFGPHFEGSFTDFLVENCSFETMDSSLPFQQDSLVQEPTVFKTQVAFNVFGQLNQFSLSDNQFEASDSPQHIYLSGEFQNLFIYGNKLGPDLYTVAKVSSKFDFDENEVLGNLLLADLIIEGKNNIIHWRQFEGFKFGVGLIRADMFTDLNQGYNLSPEDEYVLFRQTSNFGIATYKGDSDADFEDEDLFQSLISSYYRMYKLFKENGQISDANKTYVEMKDVQLKQLKYRFQKYEGLENFIQWRLNQLLRFYTDYGTNPARAIRISIFVMAIFSIFYFFFPSEWDTKSKAQLIADYKVFVEKNDKGYFKPFLRLSKGFAISLVNAMTLSLNSFVTLGFGSIPTYGLARYVCILQGFIGWFLLSIFTASLINQVMF